MSQRTALATNRITQLVQFWRALLGAVALVLAHAAAPELPEHDAVIGVAFAVVELLIFQGLTVPRLLKGAAVGRA